MNELCNFIITPPNSGQLTFCVIALFSQGGGGLEPEGRGGKCEGRDLQIL